MDNFIKYHNMYKDIKHHYVYKVIKYHYIYNQWYFIVIVHWIHIARCV